MPRNDIGSSLGRMAMKVEMGVAASQKPLVISLKDWHKQALIQIVFVANWKCNWE